MNISLTPKVKKALTKRMKRGGYTTAEDALLASLEQQEAYGDFGPGELDKLLTEGEADIARGDVEDVEIVFAELRKLGASRTGKRSTPL